MPTIDLDSSVKAEIVSKIQKYFTEELRHEIGGFEAEFLLDFFSHQVGNYFYNQGLADALQAFEGKGNITIGQGCYHELGLESI